MKPLGGANSAMDLAGDPGAGELPVMADERQGHRAPSHLPALDALRGVAVLLVLLVHFGRGGHHNALLKVFFVGVEFGWSGVDLFFVLSGFLISRILISAREGSNYFRNFYMRRVLRIFPLYYGTLIVAFCIAPLVLGSTREGGASQAWLWLYVSNFLPSISGTGFDGANVLRLQFGHFWSLAIEEQFYLLWPAIVLFVRPSRLHWVCWGMIVGALAIRCSLAVRGMSFDSIYTLTPCRMDALAVGALLACYEARTSLGRLVPAAWVAITAGAVFMGLHVWFYGSLLYTTTPFVTVGFSIIAAAYGGVLVIAVTQASRMLNRVLSSGALMSVGKYSYGIYVLHGLLAEHARRWLPVELFKGYTQSYFAALVIRMLVVMGLAYAVAWLSWHVYEKHFLKLKRFFEYSGGKAEMATAVPGPQKAVANAV